MNFTTINDPDYPNWHGDTFILESWVPGHNLWISSGVHGNEIWPIKALEELIDWEDTPIKGKIIAVPSWNPLAVHHRLRDIESRDLNRMFWNPEDGTFDQNETFSKERRRAEFLKNLMQREKPSHIIDLHSLSGKSRVPFLYCQNDSSKIAFATQLGVSHIVIWWANLAKVLQSKWISRALRPWLADYGNSVWAIALTFEAGTHDSPDAQKNTRKFLANTLAVLGMSGVQKIEPIDAVDTIMIDMVDVHIGKDSSSVRFEWVIDPVNFMQFHETTIVARDAWEDIFMTPWMVLVQPKAIGAMKPWEEAFFIWKLRESI